MVEVIGDILIPSELIVPQPSDVVGEQPQISGALIMSGAKLFFYTGAAFELISST